MSQQPDPKRKWADPLTYRGQVEGLIEPIISGGANDEDINSVVNAVLRWAKEREDAVYPMF